jgi:uncharacterized RDD family membrane protein YckC
MTYPTAPAARALVQLPPGLRVAGMGPRIGAWLIDGLLLGVFHGAFWIVAVAAGAISIDPAAESQLQASPLTLPAVAPYHANLTLLAAMMVGFVGLNIAYATFFWARFRGMPGQRLLSLQVGSASTGKNLSLGRALVRALIAVGIPMAAIAGLLYGVFALENAVPWADLMNPQAGGPTEAWLSTWSGPVDLAILGAVGWPALLLVWTAASPPRQGVHDRLANSLVVGKDVARPALYGYYPGYGPAYGPPGALPPGVMPSGEIGPAGSIDDQTERRQSWPEAAVDAPVDAAASDNPLPVAQGDDLQPPDPGSTNPYGLPPGQVPGPDRRSAWLDPLGRSGRRVGIHVATVNRRLAAYGFDCVFVYLIYLMTASSVAATLLPPTTGTLDDRTFILLGLVGGLEQMAYFVAGWRLRSGTVGQRFFKLKVADVTTGKALGWMDALVRWAVVQGPFALATIVPAGARELVILLAGGWILYLFYTTIVDPDQRGLHDRFLSSRVSQDV